MRGQTIPTCLRGLLGVLLLLTLEARLGQAAVPARVRLLAPAASVPDPTPPYTWKAVAGATAYQLLVKDSTGTRLNRWYRARTLGCAGGTGVCRVTPNVPLASGPGHWQVRARNADGSGRWSTTRRFSVIPPNGSWSNGFVTGDHYDYVTDLTLAEPLFREIWRVLHESNAPCWVSGNLQYQFYVDASFIPGPLYRYNGFDVSVGRVKVHDLGWYFYPGHAEPYHTIHIDAAFEDIYLIIVDNRTIVQVFQHFNGAIVWTQFTASNRCL